MSWELVSPKTFIDSRGTLSVLEGDRNLPFPPQRAFWVCDVPIGETRGFHAHRTGQQLLFCLAGEISATFDDGFKSETLSLRPNGQGVWMKIHVWSEQLFLKPDSILLVLASNEFDESDYIRDRGEFNRLTQKPL